jgi:hypothetical protein
VDGIEGSECGDQRVRFECAELEEQQQQQQQPQEHLANPWWT